MYLNKAIIIGNLTQDPELKSLPSGNQVTNFSVATNRFWTNKEGQKQESVEFHNVVVFGRQAENVAQYLKKGSSCLVEGRIQTRSWEGQDGNKRYRTEIIADNIQFGPRRSGSSEQGYNSSENNKPTKKDEDDLPEIDMEDIDSDDIPF